jgi:hypothetical protein
MDARERFDALTAPFSVWRPAAGPDSAPIARLLDERCAPEPGQ